MEEAKARHLRFWEMGGVVKIPFFQRAYVWKKHIFLVN
jgi:uncharacterized protein with ParB-like and HNH nuclease domain